MSEQLQKALAEIITSTVQAKDFLLSQMPAVIHQLLHWYFVVNLIKFCFSIAWAIVILTLLIRGFKQSFKREGFIKHVFEDDPDIAITMCIFTSIFSLIPTFFTFNLQWLKIYVAPKIWLIEYTKTLITG